MILTNTKHWKKWKRYDTDKYEALVKMGGKKNKVIKKSNKMRKP